MNIIRGTSPNGRKLTAKEFMIEGYDNIFFDKIDFVDLYKQYGYKMPKPLKKIYKHEILKATRDRHKEDTLNYKYWNYFLKKYGVKETLGKKLF